MEGIGSRRPVEVAQEAGADKELLDAVTTVLQERLSSLVEPIIQRAVGDFEKALRREVAITSMDILAAYQVERQGQDLLIRVRIEKDGQGNEQLPTA